MSLKLIKTGKYNPINGKYLFWEEYLMLHYIGLLRPQPWITIRNLL